MTDTGELIHGDTYAFDFRTVEPRPESPRTLLVLLHGVGGDEHQLETLGGRFAADTLVVLPRGQRSISGDRLGWFREGLSDGGPQVVEHEVEEARRKLVDFIAQLQRRFEVEPSCTVLAGFSQGGILAGAAALTATDCVGGFAMIAGRLLPECEAHLGAADSLAGLDALIVHGNEDGILPVDWARRASDWLSKLRVRHDVRLHDAGHEFTPAMEDDLLRWFGDPSRRWNACEPMHEKHA